MAKYDVFISYARRDGLEIAQAIAQSLRKKGCSVFLDLETMRAGSFSAQIVEAISLCDYFIPVITEAYNHTGHALEELSIALDCSKERSKQMIPIIAAQKVSGQVEKRLNGYTCLSMDDVNDMETLTEKISAFIAETASINQQYEKLAEYARLKNENREAETICRLIDLLLVRFQGEDFSSDRRKTCCELHRLYTRLEKYVGKYDADSRKTAHRIIETLDRVFAFLNKDADSESGNRFTFDLFMSAFAVQMIYLDREIRSECADVLTNGDAIIPCPAAQFAEKQKPFAEAFERLYAQDAIGREAYTEEEITLICNTPGFLLTPSAASDAPRQPGQKKESRAPSLTKDDEVLVSIAHFMQEGNKLFDVLQQKRIEGSFLKCLLTSYERLKAYCQIVGAADVAAQCVERIVEIRGFVEKQENSGCTDDKAEKGIRTLLGFTLHGTGAYDVFICYKNEDSDMAELIYEYCQKHLKEPFWSQKSLPELSKSEYEDAIFDALRRSRHFIVVLSKLEYLKASWIRKEMSTFDRAITEGRKTDANFVFVVTDGVYKEIIASNKMCLDERYCGYQIIKMSEYESVLYKYLG